MSEPATDWVAWHDAYADEQSELSRRMRIVRRLVLEALPRSPQATVRVLSVCAANAGAIGVLQRGWRSSPSLRQ